MVRLTPRYLAMSRPVCPLAFIRLAVSMWLSSFTFRGRPNRVPFARDAARLCAVRSLTSRSEKVFVTPAA